MKMTDRGEVMIKNIFLALICAVIFAGGCESDYPSCAPETSEPAEVLSAMRGPGGEALEPLPDRIDRPVAKRIWSRLVNPVVSLENNDRQEKSEPVRKTASPATRLLVKLGSDGRFTESRKATGAVSKIDPELELAGGTISPLSQNGHIEKREDFFLPDDVADDDGVSPIDRNAEAATGGEETAPQNDDKELLLERGFNPDAKEYLIRPGDQLEISIPYEPDTKRSVPVRPDGRITYLFDIEVMAAGRTYSELREILKQKLGEYYHNSRVTVIGTNFEGNSVFVMGPVGKPGAHTIRNNTRLLDILSSAGVLSLLPQTNENSGSGERLREVVDLEGAYVARNDRVLPVSFRDLLISRDLKNNNIFMEPGDFVFIPSSYGTEKRVYICGRVTDPKVHYYTGSLSFMEAMLEADGADTDASINGGSRDTAQARKCYVIRGGVQKPLEVDWVAVQTGKEKDISLRNGDIIYVPERSLSYGSRISTNVINEVLAPLKALLDLHNTAQDYGRRDWKLGKP